MVASWRPGAGSGCGEAAGNLAASNGWPWPLWRRGAPPYLWLHWGRRRRALANLAPVPIGGADCHFGVTAEVEAPFDHVDIAHWLKTLPTGDGCPYFGGAGVAGWRTSESIPCWLVGGQTLPESAAMVGVRPQNGLP